MGFGNIYRQQSCVNEDQWWKYQSVVFTLRELLEFDGILRELLDFEGISRELLDFEGILRQLLDFEGNWPELFRF